jgi:hypothetical protein
VCALSQLTEQALPHPRLAHDIGMPAARAISGRGSAWMTGISETNVDSNCVILSTMRHPEAAAPAKAAKAGDQSIRSPLRANK